MIKTYRTDGQRVKWLTVGPGTIQLCGPQDPTVIPAGHVAKIVRAGDIYQHAVVVIGPAAEVEAECAAREGK